MPHTVRKSLWFLSLSDEVNKNSRRQLFNSNRQLLFLLMIVMSDKGNLI